jgi:hypothetical protein
MISKNGAKTKYLYLGFNQEDPCIIDERIMKNRKNLESLTAGIVPGQPKTEE